MGMFFVTMFFVAHRRKPRLRQRQGVDRQPLSRPFGRNGSRISRDAVALPLKRGGDRNDGFSRDQGRSPARTATAKPRATQRRACWAPASVPNRAAALNAAFAIKGSELASELFTASTMPRTRSSS